MPALTAAATSSSRSRWPGRRILDHYLDPPVLLPAGRRRVAGDREVRTKAGRHDPIARDPGRHQRIRHRLRRGAATGPDWWSSSRCCRYGPRCEPCAPDSPRGTEPAATISLTAPGLRVACPVSNRTSPTVSTMPRSVCFACRLASCCCSVATCSSAACRMTLSRWPPSSATSAWLLRDCAAALATSTWLEASSARCAASSLPSPSSQACVGALELGLGSIQLGGSVGGDVRVRPRGLQRGLRLVERSGPLGAAATNAKARPPQAIWLSAWIELPIYCGTRVVGGGSAVSRKSPTVPRIWSTFSFSIAACARVSARVASASA